MQEFYSNEEEVVYNSLGVVYKNLGMDFINIKEVCLSYEIAEFISRNSKCFLSDRILKKIESFDISLDDFVMKIKIKCYKFMDEITDDNIRNIIDTLNSLEFEYYNPFLKLFEFKKCYKRVSEENINGIFDSNEITLISYILVNFKGISSTYINLIKEKILDNSRGIEILIDDYNGTKYSIEVPKYTADEVNSLVERYLKEERLNINFLNVLKNGKLKGYLVEPLLQLQAESKIQEILESNKNCFKNSYEYMASVDANKEETQEIFDGNKISFIVGVKGLDKAETDFDIFAEVIKIVNPFDPHLNLKSVNNKNFDSVFDSIASNKNGKIYSKNSNCSFEEAREHLCFMTVYSYLKSKNISLEKIIKNVLEIEFMREFGVSIVIEDLDDNLTLINKCRLLFIEMESVINQYRVFCKYKKIDYNILSRMKPAKLTDCTSCVNKRYVYFTDKIENLNIISTYLFKEGNDSAFWGSYKPRYNLYEHILLDNVKIGSLDSLWNWKIEYLVKENILVVKDGILRFKNKFLVDTMIRNYYQQVINYPFYNEKVRISLDNLIDEGYLRYENTLFSTPEKEYINYLLNRNGFDNGLDLRNKYIHGSYIAHDVEYSNDYFVGLRMFCIIIAKIHVDLGCYIKNNKKK